MSLTNVFLGSVHVGYIIEQGVIVGQSFIFLVLAIIQAVKWSKKKRRTKTRAVQKSMIAVCSMHNT
jgi:hypothetical protein